MAAPDLNTIPGSFAGLQQAFLPEKAQGVNKTIQFDFSGAEAGTWTAKVADGQFSYHEGPAENPNATVSADSADWLKILGGQLNPVSAFMGGKLKVKGDMSVMMQFQNWFQRPS
jgi:putative sterol carrier protein